MLQSRVAIPDNSCRAGDGTVDNMIPTYLLSGCGFDSRLGKKFDENDEAR